MKFLHLVLRPWICSSVSYFRVYGSLNIIWILLLYENCINLSYVQLVHSASQVYYILLLLCIFILLLFESLILSVCVLVTELCLTLCDPMDYRFPGSSVHETLQARILEWVAISFSRGSSQPRNRTQVSCIVGRFLTIWATRETL